jgi:ribose 5-phosphate isomerase B
MNELATKKLMIGADHAGFELKGIIIRHLEAIQQEVHDFGAYSADSVDYPDFAHPVAEAVLAGETLGVLVCGSGNGVCMTANKHAGIRAALCWTEELAALARQHNNANILCIPARFVDQHTALAMLDTFINTPFEGGRHGNRVHKIDC